MSYFLKNIANLELLKIQSFVNVKIYSLEMRINHMKIAFVDIDGTVLDFSKNMDKPSDITVLAFKKFREKGNILICATSRSRLPISVLKEWFDGFILNNGQYIEIQGKILLENNFSTEQVKFLYDLFKKHGAGSAYSGINGSWMAPENKELAIKHSVHYGLDITKIDQIIKPFVLENIECSAITATFDDPDKMKKLENDLPQEWENHAYYDPNDLRIDIHLPGITKGSSCMKVVEYFNLNRDDSYAIGDGMNDKEMLELVGYGIAMGNADEHLKTIANVVTDDLFNDGLAKAFNQLFELDLNIK